MTRWRRLILGSAFALAVASASCGSDAGNAMTAASPDQGGNEAIDFGEPAPPEAANRTVRVTALDAPAFSPSHIAVAKGETITFEVANTGENRHEFIIGDADFQKEHEQEMASSDMSMARGQHAHSGPRSDGHPGVDLHDSRRSPVRSSTRETRRQR
jgi:uncharacterized cupredoxin-like copper-binding protein